MDMSILNNVLTFMLVGYVIYLQWRYARVLGHAAYIASEINKRAVPVIAEQLNRDLHSALDKRDLMIQDYIERAVERGNV